jgi:NitT/TauT family transport system substrate-binding protein
VFSLRHFTKIIAALVLLAVAVVGPPAPAAERTAIKFALGWKVDGTTAPFLVAIDKGYFKAEGVEVSLIEPSSPETDETAASVARRVAAAEVDLGFGDINTLIRMRGRKEPVAARAVYVLYNKPAYAVIGRKSRGTTNPKSLEGNTVGAPTRDSASTYWKIFVRANALDESKIKVEPVSRSVREPMLAAGQVDAVIGLSFISYIDLLGLGIPASDITSMLMADFGVELYGHSIIVNDKFAADHPEAVKGFLRALTRGLKETIARPQSAIELLMKRNGDLRRDLELERLKLTIQENILTPEAKALGFGAVSQMRLEKSIEQIGTVSPYEVAPRAVDIFDESFLPAAAQRKTN